MIQATGYAVPILFFTVADQTLGTELKWVKEVVTSRNLMPLPNANSFVAGVVNIRGDVISVIDSSAILFGEQQDNHQRIIILDINGAPAGLAVQDVSAVQPVVPEAFEALSAEHNPIIPAQYISGLMAWENGQVPVIDIPVLLEHLESENPSIKEARA